MNVLLIPYKKNDSILLPKTLVKYILPYAPLLPSSFKSDMVIGMLIYESEKIPVVDFSKELDISRGVDIVPKLIIVSCVSENTPVDSYAVISRRSPTLLDLSENDLDETNEPVSGFFKSLVRVRYGSKEQLAFVPNIEKTETEIFSQ